VKMRAAVLYGPGDLRIEPRLVPSPEDHEVLLAVLAVGVCGTDFGFYRSGPLAQAPANRLSGRFEPFVIGHEVIARVERAAANGKGPRVGDLVAADVVVGCGTCWWCSRHQDGQCPSLRVRGQDIDGGMAEFMVADAITCVKIPDEIPLTTAVLAEPTAVAVRAVRKISNIVGCTAIVLGGGAVGQLVAQVLIASGAANVLLSDPFEDRRVIAELTDGVTAVAPDEVARSANEMAEPGCDAVFECTGRPGLLTEAITLVRRGGTVVAVGLPAGGEEIPVSELVLAERAIVGSAAHLWDDDVATGLALMARGAIAPGRLLTEIVDLEELKSVLENGPARQGVKTAVFIGGES